MAISGVSEINKDSGVIAFKASNFTRCKVIEMQLFSDVTSNAYFM